MTKTDKIQTVAGSNKVNWLIKHSQALDHSTRLDIGEAFTLPIADYRAPLLRDIASNIVGRSIVVIEWPEHGVYEIQRLPDNVNPDLYYAHCTKGKKKVDNVEDRLLILLEQYFDNNAKYWEKYDPKVELYKHNHIISYTLMQRRLSCIASFRRYPGGATKAIKFAINWALEHEYLKIMDKDKMKKEYNLSGKLYQVNMAKIKNI